jgi:hypothetical protein
MLISLHIKGLARGLFARFMFGSVSLEKLKDIKSSKQYAG